MASDADIIKIYEIPIVLPIMPAIPYPTTTPAELPIKVPARNG